MFTNDVPYGTREGCCFMPTVWYPDCLYHCPEGRGSPDQSSQACDLQWYRYCSAPCPAQYIASRRSLFSEYGPSRRDEKDSPHRSSTMATPNEHPSLDPSMGNLFIGLGVFSTMLYGFSCTQFIYYLRHYWTRDRPAMRCLVLFIWLLDTVVTVSDSYILWFYLVQRHGRLSSLLVSPKLYELEYATTGAITCIVQIFYVRQMWQLLYASTYRMRLLNSMIPVSAEPNDLHSGSCEAGDRQYSQLYLSPATSVKSSPPLSRNMGLTLIGLTTFSRRVCGRVSAFPQETV
ncbi:uncharacterized protein C8Q71DRAFT_469702 [Rhodofomes roseus]|uniref:Uncharacterized protein n=1 Tax=Rhodofomes roseus TaxID=34475 RepID=A0ABQ8KQ08_9APHY|nr:uncharacterized protein C8Q71DRAFT_469702 [Rhodofomes roseus]KAH9839947.1 hypothetical protein C8Q71DRAFT_469702 [Rhodofomes roseus]